MCILINLRARTTNASHICCVRSALCMHDSRLSTDRRPPTDPARSDHELYRVFARNVLDPKLESIISMVTYEPAEILTVSEKETLNLESDILDPVDQ